VQRAIKRVKMEFLDWWSWSEEIRQVKLFHPWNGKCYSNMKTYPLDQLFRFHACLPTVLTHWMGIFINIRCNEVVLLLLIKYGLACRSSDWIHIDIFINYERA
jgi:hypothetical protein